MDFENKKVLVRLDLDVPIKYGKIEDNRLQAGLATLYSLKDKAKQIIILGHMGRPEGPDESLSTKQLLPWFQEKLSEVEFYDNFENFPTSKIVLFENLRFWEGEQKNDPEFVKQLASLGEVFVNDSFAVSHRESASIVGLPAILPSELGEQFKKEIENLSKVFDNPARPVMVTLSGVKDDKLTYIDSFKEKADKILVAGRLGEYLGEDFKDPKTEVARLIQDKEDITIHSIESFESILSSAKTILVSGPMGKFEEEGHRLGTERVFRKIAENEEAFKVAGGGDTEHALEMFGIKDKFNWVSTGGGAMLEFLANGTLPGLAAIKK